MEEQAPAAEPRQALAAELHQAPATKLRLTVAALLAPRAEATIPQPTAARYYRLLAVPDDQLTREERADLNQILLTSILRAMDNPQLTAQTRP